MFVHYHCDIWKTLRWYFFNIQAGICPECLEVYEMNEMELHHILSKSKGGRENEENLQMLCKICHRTKIVDSFYD